MFKLFFCKLHNSFLNYILQACVLLLYIFTNVLQACLGDCILNMHNHGIKHTHRKLIQNFPIFFISSFFGLNLLWCGVFWDNRFICTTNYELQIILAIKKFIILNFHTWKLFLSNFLIAILERKFIIS